MLQTFNKIDVARHQFVLDWMNDFETFAQGVYLSHYHSTILLQYLCAKLVLM